MDDKFILLLQEVKYHPRSYMSKLDARFETPSIVRITRKEELRKITKAPLFDEKYLVIFESIKAFEDNLAFLSFAHMFPVLHLETASQIEDAKFLCKEFSIPYKVYNNKFTREDAIALIQENASETVSDAVIKAIIRQVGLSPLRIMTAVGVCEQMGYKVSTVERYIDKWIYPDLRKLIECLLGVPSSKTAMHNAMRYLHLNRHWYRYVKRNLIDELNTVLEVYKAKLSGELYSENLYAFIEEEHITRARVMFGLKLFENVSIASVFALREFLVKASLMDVVLRLS